MLRETPTIPGFHPVVPDAQVGDAFDSDLAPPIELFGMMVAIEYEKAKGEHSAR